MKRRSFMFRSAAAAALLTPFLRRRKTVAQTEGPRRLFVWVSSGGYPRAEDFFPEGDDLTSTPILGALAPLASELTVVDGLDIRPTGPRPRGNDHVRSIGKVLTAKDVFDIGDDDGEPGGPSIDHLIADALGARTARVKVNNNRPSMRDRPFATGPRRFATPERSPSAVWARLFRDFTGGSDGGAGEEALRHRLLARQSLLDGLNGELRRFRAELGSIERIKLDVLEDSIRRAEMSVAEDLERAAMEPSRHCEVGDSPDDGRSIPQLTRAHYDVMHAALSCDRVDIAGMMFGRSGYKWRYHEWLDVSFPGNSHDDVHHKASERRETYNRIAAWDWEQLGNFLQRLRDTPDGPGTMLDSTLVMAVSHFGRHHRLERIPFVLAGSAGGRLRPGRVIRLPRPTFQDKALTSVAHLMGVPLEGIGDDPTCGPLTELYG